MALSPLSKDRLLASPWLRAVLAFASGAATVGAFAPFDLFPLAILAPALILWLWGNSTPRQGLLLGWFYGAGLFGFGVFWLHISISQFGSIPTALSVTLTLLFCAAMALYYGLMGWACAHLRGIAPFVLAFPALWLLGEWLRGWLFTGFPWLALGYSQIDGPLAGWAPLVGVYGLSLWTILTAALLVELIRRRDATRRALALGCVLVLWGGGAWLARMDWTQPSGKPIPVSLVQGNVPQEEKWRADMLGVSIQRYVGLSRERWAHDRLIIWPETAIPAFSHRMEEPVLRPLDALVRAQGSEILLGVVDWDGGSGLYYNSMRLMGGAGGAYHKRHLVPFGEFMPMRGLIAPLLEWMEVPMSSFAPGAMVRPLLTLAGYPAGISICYEAAFGDEVREALPEAAFLVNTSNDAWFGDSIALPQHLQIARMRALETGRWMLRATNTGISALIGPHGEIRAESPRNEVYVVSGEIVPRTGMTPFARGGNTPAILLALLMLAFAAYRRRAA